MEHSGLQQPSGVPAILRCTNRENPRPLPDECIPKQALEPGQWRVEEVGVVPILPTAIPRATASFAPRVPSFPFCQTTRASRLRGVLGCESARARRGDSGFRCQLSPGRRFPSVESISRRAGCLDSIATYWLPLLDADLQPPDKTSLLVPLSVTLLLGFTPSCPPYMAA